MIIHCTSHSNQVIYYNNFDVEIFVAGCPEFVYTISSPGTLKKGGGGGGPKRSADGYRHGRGCGCVGNNDNDDLVNVIVMTKTGHRQAMKELETVIHG